MNEKKKLLNTVNTLLMLELMEDFVRFLLTKEDF